MSERKTYYLRGKAMWAKILGEPVKNNFDPDQREWTIDFVPNAEGLAKAKSLKLNLKDRDGGKVIQFRQREKRQDGSLNQPITVVGPDNERWNPEDKIGNGSDVDVKFEIVDYGKGKRQGVYLKSVRVLNHVRYERQEFAPLPEDDEFFKPSSKAAEDKAFRETFMGEDALDDDMPI